MINNKRFEIAFISFSLCLWLCVLHNHDHTRTGRKANWLAWSLANGRRVEKLKAVILIVVWRDLFFSKRELSSSMQYRLPLWCYKEVLLSYLFQGENCDISWSDTANLFHRIATSTMNRAPTCTFVRADSEFQRGFRNQIKERWTYSSWLLLLQGWFLNSFII